MRSNLMTAFFYYINAATTITKLMPITNVRQVKQYVTLTNSAATAAAIHRLISYACFNAIVRYKNRIIDKIFCAESNPKSNTIPAT